MYIALSQPEIPELKATVKITPVAKEDMKVRNHYQRNFWDSSVLKLVVLSWLAFALITGVSKLVW